VTDRPRTCALPGSPLERERGGLDACVHCGFCLPACPTYLALEDENDSPRGRLVLMGALLDGRIEPDDPDAARHLDQCLGCRGCETACPSGVPYGRLLEATRETLAVERPLGWRARLVLAVFAREWALRFVHSRSRGWCGDWGSRRWQQRCCPGRSPCPRRCSRPRLGRRAGPAAAAGAASSRSTDTAPCPASRHRHPAHRLRDGGALGQRQPGHRARARTHMATGWGTCPASSAAARSTRTPGMPTPRANSPVRTSRHSKLPARSGSSSNSAGCGAMCREYAHLLQHDQRVGRARDDLCLARPRRA
jgi:glycolate oxidase iron-sulfur subunit